MHNAATSRQEDMTGHGPHDEGTVMAFDANNVKMTDWGVMGCAAALLLFSFVSSFVTASVDVGDEFEGVSGLGSGALDTSEGISAWNSYAALGLLLLLAVGVLAAARVLGGITLPSIPVGWNLVLAGAAGLGALLVVLRAFTYSESADLLGVSVDVGPGWSGWLVMLLAIGETVFAVLAFRDSGEPVPWQQRSSAPPA